MQGAQKSLKEQSDYRFPETGQMKNAKKLAGKAVRSGEKVRFKIPDGELGSLYVRVGDQGTARFSDHAQPMDYLPDGTYGPVGGYASDLGRRHMPARISVDPAGSSLEDAFRLFFGR